MTTYARIVDGLVWELFDMPAEMADRPIEELFNPDAGTWVDVTSTEPKPAFGWEYDGSTFTPPPAEDAGEARIAWAQRLGYPIKAE
jgi:hypothetical protein